MGGRGFGGEEEQLGNIGPSWQAEGGKREKKTFFREN